MALKQVQYSTGEIFTLKTQEVDGKLRKVLAAAALLVFRR